MWAPFLIFSKYLTVLYLLFGMIWDTRPTGQRKWGAWWRYHDAVGGSTGKVTLTQAKAVDHQVTNRWLAHTVRIIRANGDLFMSWVGQSQTVWHFIMLLRVANNLKREFFLPGIFCFMLLYCNSLRITEIMGSNMMDNGVEFLCLLH